jgi:hypothetical protein
MQTSADVVNLPVADAAPRETPEAERLAAALASIRADAREHASRYQTETIVPEGGE